MRRLGLIVLAWMMATSACFGASGAWRCANGSLCAFAPGIGFHCPGMRPSSTGPSTVKSEGGFCPRCHAPAGAHAKSVAASSPCASVCGKCQCRFEVVSSHVPATIYAVAHIAPPVAAEQPVLFPSNPAPAIGFATRPLVFTTGPPALPSAAPLFPLSSRAPPRLLSA